MAFTPPLVIVVPLTEPDLDPNVPPLPQLTVNVPDAAILNLIVVYPDKDVVVTVSVFAAFAAFIPPKTKSKDAKAHTKNFENLEKYFISLLTFLLHQN